MLDPDMFKYAIGQEDEVLWKEAIVEEIELLKSNDTWTLVNRPQNQNIVSTRWFIKSKLNLNGLLERRKARLVAWGCSQKEGVDYFETFAPIVWYESVRGILYFAAIKNFFNKKGQCENHFSLWGS